MTARQKFIAYALRQLEKPALWGAKGPAAFDCSGLVTCALREAGAGDHTQTHNAQHLFDDSMPLPEGMQPLPGDLLFFGADTHHVEHIAIVLAGGHALDAAGATPHLPTLEQAVASGASVRVHNSLQYRPHFLGVHRNFWVDALDLVCT